MKITSEISITYQITGTDSPVQLADELAQTGDVERAKAFASLYPQHIQLLEQAFARNSPGSLHELQEQIPTAFASASPSTHVDLRTQPDSNTPSVVVLPPIVVTPPAPPPAPPTPPPAPPPSGGNGPIHGGGGGGGGGISSAAGAHSYLIQNFDLDFIRGHEATSAEVLKAKVPADDDGNPLGDSGITIGYGVDLGHYDADRLQALADSGSLKQSFVDTITPYVGYTGDDAQDYLKHHPLSFTESDRSQLDALSDIRYANILYERSVDYYNAVAAETQSQPHFLTELPKAAATAIADVAVQYRPPLAESVPNFWSQVVHAQWHAAAANLDDFGDAFTTRRHDDEAKLREAISAGLRDGEY